MIMGKRSSKVVISERNGLYYANVTGMFGGGYIGAFAGINAKEAAIFALREESRYVRNNPLGGTIIAPLDVEWELVFARSEIADRARKSANPILPDRMDRLLGLIDRVQCALGEIHMMYRNRGEFTQGDAELHMPVLLEASNLIYFLQDAARRRIVG
jgi:hypothetical protein